MKVFVQLPGGPLQRSRKEYTVNHGMVWRCGACMEEVLKDPEKGDACGCGAVVVAIRDAPAKQSPFIGKSGKWTGMEWKQSPMWKKSPVMWPSPLTITENTPIPDYVPSYQHEYIYKSLWDEEMFKRVLRENFRIGMIVDEEKVEKKVKALPPKREELFE